MACGFLGGYLPAKDIDELIVAGGKAFPDFYKVIDLEPSRELRPIRAVKMGKGSSPTRRGVLIVGGLHARELMNPDALLYFMFHLGSSYLNNKDFIVGGQKYSAAFIRALIDNMDIFFIPLTNPDGRAFVLSPGGDRLWRGNRAPNPGKPCKGVDVNRNFNFLWSSTLGSSTDSCNETYKGPAPFSEPETLNVRIMLDAFPHIVGLIDVHSFSEIITYPWGADEVQTTDPSMSFTNPAYKGKQGTKGDAYKEYMPPADLAWYKDVGKKMAQAIAAVRGRQYTVKQSVDIYSYTHSSTSSDYAYSRHLADGSKRKVLSFCIESGPRVPIPNPPYTDLLKSFQPSFPEAACIMEDIQPALIEFCLQILCAAQSLIDGVKTSAMKVIPSDAALPSPTATRFVKLLEQNRRELIELARQDVRLWRQTGAVLERVLPILQGSPETADQAADADTIRRLDTLLGRLSDRGSARLQRATQSIRQDLKFFDGKTAAEGFREADAQPRRRK